MYACSLLTLSLPVPFVLEQEEEVLRGKRVPAENSVYFTIPAWNETKHQVVASLGGEVVTLLPLLGQVRVKVDSAKLVKQEREKLGLDRVRIQKGPDHAAKASLLCATPGIIIEPDSEVPNDKVLVIFFASQRSFVAQVADQWSTVLQDYEEPCEVLRLVPLKGKERSR